MRHKAAVPEGGARGRLRVRLRPDGDRADGRLVEGGIEIQTRQVMGNIKAILAEAGCSMADVAEGTCWIEDPRDFARFNAVYREYFGDHPPARSTLRARLVLDGKLEIEAIAYKPR